MPTPYPVRKRRNAMKLLLVFSGSSDVGDVPHWKCPSCGLVCFCTGAAAFLPHVDCRRPQDAA